MAGPRSISRRHNEQGCAREAARGSTASRGRIREMARGGAMSRSGPSDAADVFENGTANNFRRVS